jgi:hypothetical protein
VAKIAKHGIFARKSIKTPSFLNLVPLQSHYKSPDFSLYFVNQNHAPSWAFFLYYCAALEIAFYQPSPLRAPRERHENDVVFFPAFSPPTAARLPSCRFSAACGATSARKRRFS